MSTGVRRRNLRCSVVQDLAAERLLRPIAETIRQYQELVRIHNFRPIIQDLEMQINWEYNVLTPDVTQKFDSLLRYTIDSFGKDECPKEEVAMMFRRQGKYNTDGKDLSVEVLSGIVRGVIPVMVAKYVLGVHKMRICASTLPNWKEFVRRYADKLPNV